MSLRKLACVVALTLCLSLPFSVAQTGGGGQGGGMGQGQGMGKKGGERHPAIRAAINALERAKADLKAAKHDFGGHREDALKACDEAIRQLHQALQYDKK